MNSFKAIVIKEDEDKVTYGVEQIGEEGLSHGDVFIKVAYSSINYKDMLAVQKKGGVIREYPMIPGIDLSGTVVRSADFRFQEGQEVVVTGFAMGMSHKGGFAEYARVPADWVVPVPENLKSRPCEQLNSKYAANLHEESAKTTNGEDSFCILMADSN